VRRGLVSSVGLAALLIGAMILPAAAVESGSSWSQPRPVPGSDGLWWPASATAADGTDIVLWNEPGPSGLQNQLRTKVRLAGRRAWIDVPARLHGKWLSFGDLIAVPGGDFWVLYNVGLGRTLVARLDRTHLRWTRPVEVFQDNPGYYYRAFRLGGGRTGEIAVLADATPIVRSHDGFDTRVAVATQEPGKPWTSQFLNPEGTAAGFSDMSINRFGDIAISFVQGLEDPQHQTVRAATRPGTQDGVWRVDILSSSPERVGVARTSMAADGTAYVVWTAAPPWQPDYTMVQVSSLRTRDLGAAWVSRSVVTSTTIDPDAFVVAGRGGEATAFWRQVDSMTSAPLYMQYFDNGANPGNDPVQLTRSDEFGIFMDATQGPDERILVLTRRENLNHTELGLEVSTIKNGRPGHPTPLTSEADFERFYASGSVAVDAANRGQVVYAYDDDQGQRFIWQGQVSRPSVVNRRTGELITKSRVKGRMRLGARLLCQSGFWVEAYSVAYQWNRDGTPINAATRHAYRVRPGDAGRNLTCRVQAANYVGTKTVTSRPRSVRSPSARVAFD